VNSRESKVTLSFCVSLKRRTGFPRLGGVRLDDVDAPGVRPGDEAALLQDDSKQHVDVAHRGHGAGDVNQLAELVAVAPQPAALRFGASLGLEQLQGAMHRQVEVVAPGIGVDHAGQPAAQGLPQRGIARPAHQDEQGLALGEAIGKRGEQLARAIPESGRREDHAELLLRSSVGRRERPPRRHQQLVRSHHRVGGQARVVLQEIRDAVHGRTRRALAHATQSPTRRWDWRAFATRGWHPCAHRPPPGARGAGRSAESRCAGRPSPSPDRRSAPGRSS